MEENILTKKYQKKLTIITLLNIALYLFQYFATYNMTDGDYLFGRAVSKFYISALVIILIVVDFKFYKLSKKDNQQLFLPILFFVFAIIALFFSPIIKYFMLALFVPFGM